MISPDFFADNSEDIWGKRVGGFLVLSPEEVYRLKAAAVVYVTCGRYAEVKKQLLNNGIPGKNIIRSDSIYSPEMIYSVSDMLSPFFSQFRGGREPVYDCLLDLSCGMVLGGVERWSYSIAAVFKNLKIKSAYMLPENRERNVADTEIPAVLIKDEGDAAIVGAVEGIISSGAKGILCNFPFGIMQGACLVKKYVNPKLKILAVIHNDEDIYYRAYSVWEKYIDICFTISSKMKKTLLDRGWDSAKIRDLYWEVPCRSNDRRKYSSVGNPIRIGYAGRISVRQKRVDLLLEIGEKLRDRGVKFFLNLAGAGDYEEQLVRQIKDKTLCDVIRFMGVVKHEKMEEFWREQDICISCSEWEGHSIAHSEAMAAGAVLVITNTSGAEDDVENGVNGFVTEIGDVDKMVENIYFLYMHREVLPVMGGASIRKIIARNTYMQSVNYWKKIWEIM